MKVEPKVAPQTQNDAKKLKTGNNNLNNKNSTSNKPSSKFLFVKNFVRPFTKNAVESLFKQKGNVEEWAMDPIKSKAYIAVNFLNFI